MRQRYSKELPDPYVSSSLEEISVSALGVGSQSSYNSYFIRSLRDEKKNSLLNNITHTSFIVFSALFLYSLTKINLHQD